MPFRDFYSLQQLPFAKGIAPKDVYPSSGHQELVARLTFALQYRLPALVTGDVGAGKSTSLRAFLSTLDPNVYPVAYLPNPHLNSQALYREILEAFHVEPAFLLVQLLPQLRATLNDLARRDRYPIVVVDEAHLLPAEILHQLRFLLNRDMDAATPFTLILLGQPELRYKLKAPPYEALRQRIGVRFHLPPLDLAETAGFIKHHLRIAGAQGTIFSDGFIAGAHRYTKGIARQINTLCLNALLIGCAQQQRVLDETTLKHTLLELGDNF